MRVSLGRLAVAAALSLTGPAALVAQDTMDRKDHDGMMMPVAKGAFRGADNHKAAGSYEIVAEKGKHLLRTSADLDVDRSAPDVYLVLARGARVSKDNGVWLGKLKGHTGAQDFAVPAGASLEGFDTVVLWCKKYGVPIGVAAFDPTGLMGMKDKMKDKMMEKQGR